MPRQGWYSNIVHKSNDQPIHSATGKANALNSHFKSVFTEENSLTIPTIDSHTVVPSMLNITISQSRIDT